QVLPTDKTRIWHCQLPTLRLATIRPSAVVLLLVVVVVITTWVSLRTALGMVLLAAALAAVSTALFAAALVPDRVRQHVQCLHWDRRIVAGNDQLAGAWALLSRLVSDGEAQAGTWLQGRWEWIVEELPMGALALECNLAHVELAVADIADGDRAV